MALTLTATQRLLLGIISSVEAGITSPIEAMAELNELKAQADDAGLKFRADYTVEDFENIRQVFVATYETSQDPYPAEDTYYESSY
jgi:hypothetical protein